MRVYYRTVKSDAAPRARARSWRARPGIEKSPDIYGWPTFRILKKLVNNLKPKNTIPPIKSTLILHQYAGLEYVTITNIPVIRIGDSSSPSEIRTSSKINEAVAKTMLKRGLAIRGKELRFFRVDLLRLSQEKFARELDLSSITILNWEKISTKRLHPINELAVRALVAEKLSLSLKLRLLEARSAGISDMLTVNEKITVSAKNLVKFNEL